MNLSKSVNKVYMQKIHYKCLSARICQMTYIGAINITDFYSPYCILFI